MTSPIFQAKNEKKIIRVGMMSFVLPSKYRGTSLLAPLISGIEILKIPSLTVAALRYTGKNTEAKIYKKMDELKARVDFQPGYLDLL